ncbi:hypothetical protein VB005_08252 [Metarhizium brunneum]
MFPNTIWRNLTPPEKHPGFRYEGHRPGDRIELPRGHVLRPGFGPFKVNVILEIDTPVIMRDGKKLYTNIYRPSRPDADKLPALIAWSPYGKCAGGTSAQNYDSMGPYRMGIPYQNLSGYETFEGPNPADWSERGYVVVDPDARGACHSEGDINAWGPQEAIDIYDFIDWCSKQDWCDGSVVMFGNSWLAISQINHATRCRHPALKAIAPWEAMTDPYQQVCCRGGVSNENDPFGKVIVQGFAGMSKAEDIWSNVGPRPLYDDYWESKSIDVKKLDIPMYLTASYSSRLHSWGSFTTFGKATSTNKWLRVHASQEWHDLYRKEAMDDLQRFYDCFAKGKVDNGWMETPRLRLSLIGMCGSIAPTINERPEAGSSFPLSRTKSVKYFLDASTMELVAQQPEHQSRALYEAHSFTAQAVFTMKFSKYTELSGFPWVKLYMSCKEKDDMDVNVIIRKIGVSGELLEHANYPMPVPIDKIPDSNVAKFQGPNGLLRASHRVSILPREHIDEPPRYSHRFYEKVTPGSPVALEIPIWPIGMVFEQGEGLALVIAGHDLRLPEILNDGGDEEPRDSNVGRHEIYTGSQYDSFIIIPEI